MRTEELIVDQFRLLDVEEKLSLLRTLWDEVEGDAHDRGLSVEERGFLDDRERDLHNDSRPDRSWHEVRDELLQG